ncbi:MAG: hypothetical protein HY689_05610 [Chloroflexi bacterium]|nr:hypothetical protein [Chloroflexota bacterium]
MTVLAPVCLVVLVACLIPCLYRVAMGPHALDRLVAFDLVGVLLAAVLAVFALIQGSWVYLEISLALVLLAFVATLSIAHYIERGRVF